MTTSAQVAREAARRPDGQFGTQERAEADGVTLDGTAGGDAPLERAEVVRAWALENDLLQMSDPDETLGMPNGWVVTIQAADDDPGTAEGIGIIEKGQYTALQFDADGRETGAFSLLGFDDLSQRKEQARTLSERMVRAAREGADAPAPVLPPLPDSAYDPEQDSNLVDFGAEEIAAAPTAAPPEPEPEPEPARATLGATIPEGSTTSNGVATAPDGTKYVDDPGSFWHGTEIISRYTREQALADGVLVDHSDLAREAGISWPVVVTIGAQRDAISWNDSNAGSQDETGRAWDVMTMARLAMAAHAKQTNNTARLGDRIPFQVMRVPNTPRATQPRLTTLHAVISAEEDGKPYFTISLPEED